MSGIFSLEEFKKANEVKNNNAIDSLREELKEKAEQLLNLEKARAHHEGIVKRLTTEAHELREEIRQTWSPFITGADSSELDFGTVKLIMVPELSVTMEDEGEVIDWLLNNGFKDVMKYQIHHSTFKSIGRKLYTNHENPVMIPGAKYNEFQKIKVV